MDGIINIYKEGGYTSHDVVAKLRGILHTKKIGHTGTLDPMAEGVLPICVGAATRLSEMLSDHDKEYEAEMVLGSTYDTLDITGVLQETREVMSTKEEITDAIRSFVGGYDQVPPMYSAKKVGGQKLYDLARSGKVVERKPVWVDIYGIDILDMDIPRCRIRVRCGKGTYIRSLIDDIGRKLGCGAAMSALTRTRSGDLAIDSAHRLAEVERAAAEGRLSDFTVSLESLFSGLPKIDADGAANKLLLNGNVLSAAMLKLPGSPASNSGTDGPGMKNAPSPAAEEGARFRMYDSSGRFAAVYEYKTAGNIFKPYKMFLN